MRLSSAVALVSIAATAILAGIRAESDIINLGGNNFTEFTKNEKLMLALFISPYMRHPLKSVDNWYEELATQLKKINIPFALIDCTSDIKPCRGYDYYGLNLFREGTQGFLHGETRNVSSIVNYMKKVSRPDVSEFTTGKIAELSALGKVVIVSSFPKNSEKGVIFEKLAKEYKFRNEMYNNIPSEEERYSLVFGVIEKNPDVEGPGVVIYKQFEERKEIWKGDFDRDSLDTFIEANCVPNMGEFEQLLENKLWNIGLPIAFYVYSTEEDRKAYGPQIEALAKELKGRMSFVYINDGKFRHRVSELNLKKSRPAFSIDNMQTRIKYPLAAEINMDNIKELVNKVLDGTAVGSVRSAPIPESNDGPVKVVVGFTYDEIVEDQSKDVLIQYHSPCWTDCPRPSSGYEELGKLYEGSDIVIAKYEAYRNDSPSTFEQFLPPAIKLCKAGGNEYVDYSGDFTKKDLVKFINENAVNKLDVNIGDKGGEEVVLISDKVERALKMKYLFSEE
ncbi:protein disulfide-isomerase precursor [Entomortierella beljakovae]|nr:protein disulfide-isomerase precursor [Entomortierella beljakovae]